MSGSREGFSVGHDISSDKKLVFNLTNQFARPLWLNASQLKGQRWKLSIALVALLVVYLFDWGFSTERAIYCLVNKQIPAGRWIDHVALWPELPIITIVVSLLVLWRVQGKSFFRFPRRNSDWREIGCVGLAWVTPLVITREVSQLMRDTPCPGSTELKPFWGLSQLGGPAEEAWFAAAVAVWMLLWAGRPRIKLFGILVGGGVLRGIFHVYQGWESVGLFIWGAVAALAVALTGRWVLLFLLHYFNNALISALGWRSTEAAMLLLILVCMMLVGCTKLESAPKNRVKKAHAGELKSNQKMLDGTGGCPAAEGRCGTE